MLLVRPKRRNAFKLLEVLFHKVIYSLIRIIIYLCITILGINLKISINLTSLLCIIMYDCIKIVYTIWHFHKFIFLWCLHVNCIKCIAHNFYNIYTLFLHGMYALLVAYAKDTQVAYANVAKEGGGGSRVSTIHYKIEVNYTRFLVSG